MRDGRSTVRKRAWHGSHGLIDSRSGLIWLKHLEYMLALAEDAIRLPHLKPVNTDASSDATELVD